MIQSRVYTTHIGSLPFVDIGDAFSFNSKFDLPCLFTLPKRDPNEFMLPDCARVLGIDFKAGVFLKYSKKGKEISPYLEKLIESLGKKSIGFKYQLLGPYSAYHFYGFEEQNYPFEKFLMEISKRYNEIIQDLKNYGLNLFFFDEPVLSQLQKDSIKLERYLNWFFQFHKKTEVEVGIHCCGYLNLTQREFQDLPLHLDFSLYQESDLANLQEIKYLGFSKGAVPLAFNLGNFKNIKNNLIFLAPSCGLGILKISEISGIYNSLANSKQFILEQDFTLN